MSRHLSRSMRALAAAGVAFALTASGIAASYADPAGGTGEVDAARMVSHEVFARSGHIRRVSIPAATEPRADARRTVTARVTPVEVHGRSANRIDLVFLGDGYAASDQALFADNVAAGWRLLAAREPFAAYRTSFNVWRVDIVSPVSGVSGDPTADVVRDTPLDTTYWCGNIERLLCTDVSAAQAYASLAPDVDQIAVLANSTKYGGAGYYADDLATFAGNNSFAGEVLPHELGHSLGDLGDEYDYLAFPGDGSTYVGPEPESANLSIYDSYDMRALDTKWSDWLGTPSPDGGQVDTYEGGGYAQFGIYRPSQNSLMRELLREFNSPSRERLVATFYEAATPIDAVTPPRAVVRRGETVTVKPLPTATDVKWSLNGREVRRWRGKLSIRLTGVPGWRREPRLAVTVKDPTPWVIDPTYRQELLKESHSWRVVR